MEEFRFSKRFLQLIKRGVVATFTLFVLSFIILTSKKIEEIGKFALENEVLFSSILGFLWYLLVRILGIHRDADYEGTTKNFSILEVFFFPIAILISSGLLITLLGFSDCFFIIAVALSVVWLLLIWLFALWDRCDEQDRNNQNRNNQNR